MFSFLRAPSFQVLSPMIWEAWVYRCQTEISRIWISLPRREPCSKPCVLVERVQRQWLQQQYLPTLASMHCLLCEGAGVPILMQQRPQEERNPCFNRMILSV